MGVDNYFQRFALINLRVVMENYHKLPEWTKIAINQISLDVNTILAGGLRLADNARDEKKTRENIAGFLMKTLLYGKGLFENISPPPLPQRLSGNVKLILRKFKYNYTVENFRIVQKYNFKIYYCSLFVFTNRYIFNFVSVGGLYSLKF
uniref:Uncharacterized protein n=1 Tax=Meloidogyne incognita TaxID=6306 RepID=A0A914LB23_MELIC